MADWANYIHEGDCFNLLPDLPAESIHACVTDPPYGLAFMGRDWDDFEPTEYQAWCEEWAREVKRVLKPGGHLLAFSGNRTHHRLFTGVEDAGFEIRDTLTWHYGSGFPKATDVSKTIDKRADAEREVLSEESKPLMGGRTYAQDDWSEEHRGENTIQRTAPATDAAKEWDGWKTGLKPATEFVVMARKPFDGATVDCVQEHGTGALNIDGTRIETDDELKYTVTNQRGGHVGVDNSRQSEPRSPEGRYPANVVFDETAAEQLDRAVGELNGGPYTPQSHTGRNTSDAHTKNDPDERKQLDSGGPSRYSYTPKATRAERTLDGTIANAHPTVKPVDLMEWLVKLVTAEGQTVLDPFAGTGTTCRAAKDKGRRFIGIEQQAKWADVARVRCGLAPEDPSHVRADGPQAGLEACTEGHDD